MYLNEVRRNENHSCNNYNTYWEVWTWRRALRICGVTTHSFCFFPCHEDFSMASIWERSDWTASSSLLLVMVVEISCCLQWKSLPTCGELVSLWSWELREGGFSTEALRRNSILLRRGGKYFFCAVLRGASIPKKGSQLTLWRQSSKQSTPYPDP